eukprot:TRINITY_DN7166_c0_g1_i4.p1 TRINITY_DN7166_c0_g1~~TRINITY_DN7166_c0_g1_i4.p1  ORF type:complete len:308 (-),score=73.66 TRINITY_DN7166_c0_g1_i4:20-943(-)
MENMKRGEVSIQDWLLEIGLSREKAVEFGRILQNHEYDTKNDILDVPPSESQLLQYGIPAGKSLNILLKVLKDAPTVLLSQASIILPASNTLQDLEFPKTLNHTFNWFGQAKNVSLYGSWNGWAEQHMTLLNKNQWTLTIPLSTSEFDYQFKWKVDDNWVLSDNYPTILNNQDVNNFLSIAKEVSTKAKEVATKAIEVATKATEEMNVLMNIELSSLLDSLSLSSLFTSQKDNKEKPETKTKERCCSKTPQSRPPKPTAYDHLKSQFEITVEQQPLNPEIKEFIQHEISQQLLQLVHHQILLNQIVE